MKKTFLVNQSQLIESQDFLCNNLSATDLKLFLISVQKQLDDIFLVKKSKNFLIKILIFSHSGEYDTNYY